MLPIITYMSNVLYSLLGFLDFANYKLQLQAIKLAKDREMSVTVYIMYASTRLHYIPVDTQLILFLCLAEYNIYKKSCSI